MRLISEKKRDLPSSKTFAIEMHTYEPSSWHISRTLFSLILLWDGKSRNRNGCNWVLCWIKLYKHCRILKQTPYL